VHRIGKRLAAAAMMAGISLGSLALAAPASAGGNGGSLINIGNVDVVLVDASGAQTTLLQNVAVTDAANFCQINVDVLTATLLSSDKAACTAKNTTHQKAWVKKH
jgi:hypothetical protein